MATRNMKETVDGENNSNECGYTERMNFSGGWRALGRLSVVQSMY